MSKPDLSSLNEAQRQELIIDLLYRNQAMLLTLLQREAVRMSREYGVDLDTARADLKSAYAGLKQEQLAFDRLGPMPSPPQASPADRSA